MWRGKVGNNTVIKPYCCEMRRRFIIGIVAEDKNVPTPYAVCDFLDYKIKSPDGRPVIRIRYCPFCGEEIKGDLRLIKC